MTKQATTLRVGLALGLLALVALPAASEVIEIYEGDSFEDAAEALQPGDTLIVHEGTYIDSSKISIDVVGTATQPVLITGAAGEARPHITRSSSDSAQNTINILGAEYLTIRGLEISGNGGNGFKVEDGGQHITLEDLDIHDTTVGIRFADDINNVTVRDCHIHNVGTDGGHGEGMYIGCNDSACVVRDSIFEGNWIHDTTQGTQGDGIEIKAGSHSNIIRDNVIYNTRYPCILAYGANGGGRNIIEGNVMWNCGDSGIQAAADAIIRNNLILDSPETAFNSQEHQNVYPDNLEFVHNTIVGAEETCLRLDDWDGGDGMVLANNAIYCDADYSVSSLGSTVVSGNVVWPSTDELPSGGFTEGRSIAQDFLDADGLNVYPTSDSAVIDAGDAAYQTAFDFNGTSRSGAPDAGAYRWSAAQNPGWAVGPGFKDGASPDPDPDPEPPAAPTGLTVN